MANAGADLRERERHSAPQRELRAEVPAYVHDCDTIDVRAEARPTPGPGAAMIHLAPWSLQ